MYGFTVKLVTGLLLVIHTKRNKDKNMYTNKILDIRKALQW